MEDDLFPTSRPAADLDSVVVCDGGFDGGCAAWSSGSFRVHHADFVDLAKGPFFTQDNVIGATSPLHVPSGNRTW